MQCSDDLTAAVVDPVVNFLHDQIDDGGNVLYLIERFKLKCRVVQAKGAEPSLSRGHCSRRSQPRSGVEG